MIQSSYCLLMQSGRLSTGQRKTRRISLVALVAFLLVSFVACSSGTAPLTPHTLAPTVEHTPILPPVGTILYKADWSHGLADWQHVQGWQVVQGKLETTSSNATSLPIPYQPTTPHYVIEVGVQIVSILKNGGYFSISVPPTGGKDGYHASVVNLLVTAEALRPNGSHPSAQAYIDPPSSMEPGSNRPIDYEPGSQPHLFRLEVYDSAISWFDGSRLMVNAGTIQTSTLSNGPIVLTSQLAILYISSLRILAL